MSDRLVPRYGDVRVTCWCERHIVHIPARLIDTDTASCGHPDCHPPEPERNI